MANKELFFTVGACRQFFLKRDFIETPTPPLVPNPGMECHLHPFQIKSTYKDKVLPLYLHTSPEFEMKVLLSEGMENIYHLGYCFRDEPESETHRFQFLMLEWYRKGSHYHEILEDTLKLIESVRTSLSEKGLDVYETLEIKKHTVSGLFREYVGIDPLDYSDPKKFGKVAKEKLPDLVSEPFDWPWEDYFFLLFLNLIEPHFKKGEINIVDKFPAQLAALSTLDPKNEKLCQRFEIYLSGVELCNCFNELTELDTQKKRFKLEAEKKRALYGYDLPEPSRLYEALEKGLPKSSGNALGVERLLLGLKKSETNPFFR